MQYTADRARIEDGAATCQALVDECLDRIDARRSLNAFTFVDADGARLSAALIDKRRAAQDHRPLDGLILAVKDTISVEGLPLTCASALLSGFTAEFDATVVARLRAEGAIVIGKTNCDEFGMGSSSEYSVFGPVRHPADSDFSAGGSSGGSAAAVAAGLCHAALGSDTGGSVRQPAAFCGVAGLRPTWSRVSRYGLTAFASSMDTIGFLAPDAALAGRLQAAVEGSDGRDAVCRAPDPPQPVPSSAPRIGLAGMHSDPALTVALRRVADALADDGVDVRDSALPGLERGTGVYHALSSVEAASNLARFDGVRYGRRAAVSNDAPGSATGFFDSITRARSEGFGDEVRRRILLGTWLSSRSDSAARLDRARRLRARIASDFDALFDEIDLLITPTTGASPFRLGAFSDHPASMYEQDAWTIPAALAGCPAISIPVPAGLPDCPPDWSPGVQIIAPRHADEALVRFAARLQALLG